MRYGPRRPWAAAAPCGTRPTGLRTGESPSEDSLTAMEAGNALEPVVLRAMERAGWRVSPADPRNPESVSMRLRPNLLVTGHPDATGADAPPPGWKRPPRSPRRRRSSSGTGRRLLFYGDEMVVEVKTRGPEAFKRWRTLGAERSHPASVAQAAFYTYGKFGGWPPRRGDCHDGHGGPHLGLRNHPRRPAGTGLG